MIISSKHFRPVSTNVPEEPQHDATRSDLRDTTMREESTSQQVDPVDRQQEESHNAIFCSALSLLVKEVQETSNRPILRRIEALFNLWEGYFGDASKPAPQMHSLMRFSDALQAYAAVLTREANAPLFGERLKSVALSAAPVLLRESIEEGVLLCRNLLALGVHGQEPYSEFMQKVRETEALRAAEPAQTMQTLSKLLEFFVSLNQRAPELVHSHREKVFQFYQVALQTLSEPQEAIKAEYLELLRAVIRLQRLPEVASRAEEGLDVRFSCFERVAEHCRKQADVQQAPSLLLSESFGAVTELTFRALSRAGSTERWQAFNSNLNTALLDMRESGAALKEQEVATFVDALRMTAVHTPETFAFLLDSYLKSRQHTPVVAAKILQYMAHFGLSEESAGASAIDQLLELPELAPDLLLKPRSLPAVPRLCEPLAMLGRIEDAQRYLTLVRETALQSILPRGISQLARANLYAKLSLPRWLDTAAHEIDAQEDEHARKPNLIELELREDLRWALPRAGNIRNSVHVLGYEIDVHARLDGPNGLRVAIEFHGPIGHFTGHSFDGALLYSQRKRAELLRSVGVALVEVHGDEWREITRRNRPQWLANKFEIEIQERLAQLSC